VYDETFRCNSIATWGVDQEREHGNKIVLPPSSLHILSHMDVSYPMMFALENKSKQRRTHVGVIEFSGVEGKCYVPYWIMTLLGLNEGAFVSVRNLQLPSARLVKFRPQTKDFLDLADPKAFLEHQLRLFACLTKGDTISVYHPSLRKSFLIDVLDLKPANACSIIETDLSVDFAAPLDYVEPTYVRPGASTSSTLVTSIDDDNDDDVMDSMQGNSRESKRARNDSTRGNSIMGGTSSSSSSSSAAAPSPGISSPLSPSVERPGVAKIVPFAGSGHRLGGETGGGSSSSSSPGFISQSPGLGPRGSPSLSGGGIVLGAAGGTGGTGSGGKPRTLNRFEEARRAKAFQGEGQKLL
jgi:hypothetical protein